MNENRDDKGRFAPGGLVAVHESKASAIEHAKQLRAQGHSVGVFKAEQTIVHASRGDYAAKIGGNSAEKVVHYQVRLK